MADKRLEIAMKATLKVRIWGFTDTVEDVQMGAQKTIPKHASPSDLADIPACPAQPCGHFITMRVSRELDVGTSD